jgi:EAL domain-containing protein (putative c-di-GMP-specific phosphodiesterase class I)
MMGEVRPFSISTRLPTSTYIEGAKVPSISAVLADHQGAQGWFHIDFAHDPGTVPTYSYAEVLQGRVEREAFEGKSAVLAATYFGSSDFRALPFGGRIPGVYFHALGAETLKDGMPLGLGWMPAMLLIAGVLFAQASRKRPSGTLTLWTLALLALLPIVFDLASIIIEVFPALIALVIGHVQLGRLADRIYSKSTELMLPDAIVVPDGGIRIDVYALKISNLADFAESSMPRELGAFIERVLSYLGSQSEVSPKDGATAFEKDTLIWTVPSTSRAEVEDNALALFTLLSNASWASLDDARLEVTVAADVNQGIDIERRIRNASQAADLASRQGQRIMVADQTFLDDRERRLTLLTALDRSIEEGTIAIAFQPKISMNDGRMVGAETLLRWTHATLGYVNAQELVNVAEAHGRIDQLTAYITDLALADAKRVLAIRKDFKLAINVSAQSLREDTVPGHILSACERHEFPHANLILEVTESGKLDDVRVESRIADLCAAGLSLSIDDFGTGHSSLDYLQRVPSSEIKIDRRFVKTLRTSSDSAAVVRATIEMAHSLGRVVVAEGVEDDLTAETLRQMNCDLAQGYLFSRAVPMNELLVMLNRTRAAA